MLSSASKIRFVWIENRPFDNFSAERIRPVQYEERDIALRGFLHAITHGRGVGIEADTGILNIEDQCVDALQHFVRRSPRFAIEAVNGQTA